VKSSYILHACEVNTEQNMAGANRDARDAEE
jgi:hypothetical protein